MVKLGAKAWLGLGLVAVFCEGSVAALPPAPSAEELVKQRVPRQLNASSFAACLREAGADLDLEELRRTHRLGRSDLLLLYLSVYPDVRLPALSELQELARFRWAVAWEKPERDLALAILGSRAMSPGRLFELAARACGDAFCGALISHNVLRTLGRHHRGGRWNPGWFEQERDFWDRPGSRRAGALVFASDRRGRGPVR